LSAYHPQMARQSKKTNQHVEMALQIFGNFQQDNWSDWLPLIQYQLNSHASTTTKQILYETWMGFIPTAHQPECESFILALEACRKCLQDAWAQAIKSMVHAQSL
jgi:hypothetical protein